MKKMLRLIMPIGLLLIVFAILHEPDRAVGATNRVSIGINETRGTESTDPPWLDEAWHYRRPVVINSGIAQSWYQVLITLTNVNFPSFDQAKSDGSDIRVTFSDGITEPFFWIESWDSQAHLAYVWVRIAPLSNGETTLYLYYGNPSASTASDGKKTFDLFDNNWSQFISAKSNQQEDIQNSTLSAEGINLLTWNLIGGTPVVSPPGILSLESGNGIKSTTTYQYQAVGFRANFGSGTGHTGSGHEWGGFNNGDIGKGTMIGDLILNKDNLFLINFNTSQRETLLPRVDGVDWHNEYHVYEVRWKSGLSKGSIDHTASSAQSSDEVPSDYLPVTLYSYLGSNATMLVDWVYVRQYHDPEPTATVGGEQGLVDLSIGVTDAPDPIKRDVELTYLLTISNNSVINAPGVAVTDTLPSKVIYVRAIPPSCSYLAPKVTCNIGTIAANSSTTVSIVVNPFEDGLITNTVNVDSPGYELDWSNNSSQTTTLVDTIAPNVNWVEPVASGGSYSTHGGPIKLVVSAADNDKVARVDFWYWDHLDDPPGPVPIGEVDNDPYEIQFNSDGLVANSTYQVFAQAVDRAGNVTDIGSAPFPRIFITRISLYYLYLPVARK